MVNKVAEKFCNICYENYPNYKCSRCSFEICKKCKNHILNYELDKNCGQCRKEKPWLEYHPVYSFMIELEKYSFLAFKLIIWFNFTFIIFVFSIIPLAIIFVYVILQVYMILKNIEILTIIVKQ